MGVIGAADRQAAVRLPPTVSGDVVTLISSTTSAANSDPFSVGPPSAWTNLGVSHTSPSDAERGGEIDLVHAGADDVDPVGNVGLVRS